MIIFNEDGLCTVNTHNKKYTIIFYIYKLYSHLRIYENYPITMLLSIQIPLDIDKYHPSLMLLYQIYLKDVDYERIYNNV